MERLTWQNKDSTNYVDDKYIEQENYYDSGNIVYSGKAIERLAEYENTGLEPSEIEQLKKRNKKIEFVNKLQDSIMKDLEKENGELADIVVRAKGLFSEVTVKEE